MNSVCAQQIWPPNNLTSAGVGSKFGEISTSGNANNQTRSIGIGQFSNNGLFTNAILHVNGNTMSLPLNGTILTQGEVFRTSGPEGLENAWRLFTGVGNGTERFSISVPSNSDNAMLSTVQDGKMILNTNGAGRVLINNLGAGNAGGRVAIGNNLPASFTPTSRLHLHQNGGNNRIAFTNNSTGSGGGSGFQVGINGTNQALINQREDQAMRFFTNNAQRIWVNGDVAGAEGFTGIGLGFNNPQALLHLWSVSNNTGEVFRSTAPGGVDQTWRMNSAVTDQFRFYIQNPDPTPNVRMVTDLNGEINFFTNFSGSGGNRSVSFQNGVGDIVHGQVALGNDLPPNFNAESRLHLHKTIFPGVNSPGANFIQFTSDYTLGGSDPLPNSGFRVGIQNFPNAAGGPIAQAFVQMFEDQPIRFFTNGEQRMVIMSENGGPEEGYIYMGDKQWPASDPTAQLDIDGDLRIRVVNEEPSQAILLGQQHTLGTDYDLDVRRLDFSNVVTQYLSGTGTWEDLPAGLSNAHNGTSISELDPNSVALGQLLYDPNDDARFLSHREIPMNNFNLHFTDDNATDGSVNRIIIGPSTTSPALARLNVNVNPNVNQNEPLGILVANSQTANPSPGLGVSRGIRTLVNGDNAYNTGVLIEVENATNTNKAIDAVVTSTTPGTATFNSGATFVAMDGQRNRGVGGRAFSSSVLGLDNIGVTGEGVGNQKNYGGYFTGQGSGAGVDENYGIYAKTVGLAGLNYGVYGEVSHQGNSTSWAGFFQGKVKITSYLEASGVMFPSDQMFKQNIQDIGNAMVLINQLQPRTYNYDISGYPAFGFETDQQMGLVAQEVESVIPTIVSTHIHPAQFDSTGIEIIPEITYKGVEYTELIPLLIAGMQEQQDMIDEKDSLINDLNDRLTNLEQCIANAFPGLCSAHSMVIINNSEEEQEQFQHSMDVQLKNGESIVLNQNVPNPFAERTVITYTVPEHVQKAQIHFYDSKGIIINSVDITERGTGKLNVFADDLSSGKYTYTLVADGQIVATKHMVKK